MWVRAVLFLNVSFPRLPRDRTPVIRLASSVSVQSRCPSCVHLLLSSGSGGPAQHLPRHVQPRVGERFGVRSGARPKQHNMRDTAHALITTCAYAHARTHAFRTTGQTKPGVTRGNIAASLKSRAQRSLVDCALLCGVCPVRSVRQPWQNLNVDCLVLHGIGKERCAVLAESSHNRFVRGVQPSSRISSSSQHEAGGLFEFDVHQRQRAFEQALRPALGEMSRLSGPRLLFVSSGQVFLSQRELAASSRGTVCTVPHHLGQGLGRHRRRHHGR